MNERNDLNPEDQAIEQAWEQVMSRGPSLLRGGETDTKLVREYTELLGLLPYELAASAPSPELKERIMARVARGDAEAEIGSRDAVASEASTVVPFERPVAAPRPVWRVARAAVLAASLVGVGFLGATVRQQSQQIARLNDQVAAASVGSGEIQRMREEAETYRSRLHMVTNVARHAYPLHTVSAIDSRQKPEGIVYVCGMHQQWYLSLRGLEPPPEGSEYHLWFMTDDGKVDGGVLDVRAGASIEMEDLTMPRGTHGFEVTLDKRDDPESLTILLGEDVVNL